MNSANGSVFVRLRGLATVCGLFLLGAGLAHGAATASTSVGADPGAGFTRLPGHVLGTVSQALPAAPPASPRPLTLEVVMKRDDEFGFGRYLHDVYDPQSPHYRRFLSPADLSKRFGPSLQSATRAAAYFRGAGLQVVQVSKNHLTVTVRGSRAAVQRALRLQIRDYRAAERTFYANDVDPALPTALSSQVLAINGLSDLAAPQPVVKSWVYQNVCGGTPGGGNGGSVAIKNCVDDTNKYYGLYHDTLCALGTGDLAAPTLRINTYGATALFTIAIACALSDIFDSLNGIPPSLPGSGPLPSAHSARAEAAGRRSVDGTGQTIGLVEFDTFHPQDVSDYLAYMGAPAARIGNLTTKKINGGVSTPGAGETEVLLDIDTVMTLVPGAHVTVYEAPFNGGISSYTSVFNAMINDGVTIISNSWASCEDQVSLAEAQSIDAVLQTAAASGISVFNGTGDSGSTCLDGSANTISVPANSPNATAVGGTSWPQDLGPGRTYAPESWWDGTAGSPPTGQSGFGVSRYFAQPSYQSAFGAGGKRSIPDVVVRADPANGIVVCQADAGGCPSGSLNGGTSLAAPEWAAITAMLNQRQGQNLGALNPQLYALAATPAFHDAASMSSDFAHVGLGSPNINVLSRLLRGQSVTGTPTADLSVATQLVQVATAAVQADGSISVPADGTSRGGVLVNLYDVDGNSVSGKTVTLSASGGNAVISPTSGVSTVENGTVAFFVTDLTAETLTLTATDTTDGLTLTPLTLTFSAPPAASGGISANPPTVAADGVSSATITVTLKDSLNRPSPGKRVLVSTTGAHAVLTGPASGVTDGSGQIAFTATDQVNETVTFSAVDATDHDLPVPGTAAVTFSGSASTACGVGAVPVAGPGYSIAAFATGLPAAASVYVPNVNVGCPGAGNPAFPSNGSVLIADFLTGGLYKTGLGGGALSSSNVLAVLGASLSNLTYGKDGALYATQGGSGAAIVQLDPSNGAVLRTVASGLTCPAGLSVDPLSGDLFFDDDCTGAGTDDASIYRVIDPANSDAARPTSVVVYATLPHTANGGMAFAPNGTLYAVSGYYGNINAEVQQISPTTATTVTVVPVPGITSDFAVAVGATNADGSAQTLIVEPAGTLSEIPLADPTAAKVLATGTPGVGVAGPDGCLYSAHYDTIYRLANSAGGCTFAPTSPAPRLVMTPGTLAVNPVQGNAQTLTATLGNVASPAGTPVTFVVAGVNLQRKVVTTDASGNAVLSYVGAVAGADAVTATAVVGTAVSTPLQSNTVNVTWTGGRHLAFMTLNLSPQAGQVNLPATIKASLADVTQRPVAAVAGQTITMSLGSAACTATTDATGVATCNVTPAQVGVTRLSASFAGSETLSSASVAAAFSVVGAAAAPPTVTLAVAPTAVAAGSNALLSWSSSNATACVASGAWSGAQAVSGSQNVTPADSGSFTYTLTCTGDGGSAAASAVLTANLVPVTVTAKSGGGALHWYVVLWLGVLVVLRACSATRGARIGLLTLGIALCGASGSPPSAAADNFYAGVRVGSMPVRLDAGKITQGLDARGYDAVTASVDTTDLGATAYVGYELTTNLAAEFGFTHRNSSVARLNGTLGSNDDVVPLLKDTTRLIRGYGNLYSLAAHGRFEFAPRFTLEPRAGGFFWDTRVTAVGNGESLDATHRGGGVTLGMGVAYRLWRGLELGVGADHYRGFPNNIATLYAGSLEWRFGR